MTPLFYETRMALADDGVAAMWSGDAGYEAEDPSIPGPRHRLTMSSDSYRLDRSDG